jgi:hypothetical protein
LVLLNDVQYLESARVLGEQMIRQGGRQPRERITYAFRALTSRYPRPEEMNILLNLYRQEYQDFTNTPGRAARLLAEGDHAADKKLPANEVAACTIIASTLMSFDEFTMKR